MSRLRPAPAIIIDCLDDVTAHELRTLRERDAEIGRDLDRRAAGNADADAVRDEIADLATQISAAEQALARAQAAKDDHAQGALADTQRAYATECAVARELADRAERVRSQRDLLCARKRAAEQWEAPEEQHA